MLLKSFFERFNVGTITAIFDVYMSWKILLFDLKANEFAYVSRDPPNRPLAYKLVVGFRIHTRSGNFYSHALTLLTVQAAALHCRERGAEGAAAALEVAALSSRLLTLSHL